MWYEVIQSLSAHRYIELNAKCSSGYRVYSQNVLLYLRDKPRIVAEHIISRHQTTPQQYSVSFGSESQMPSCTCKDWQKNLFPCMDFCAVFNLVPVWSWDSLRLTYRGNPLFALNKVCLGTLLTAQMRLYHLMQAATLQ